MHPAWSVIVFTTVAGAAQGMVVVLALLSLVGVPLEPVFLDTTLGCALALLVSGLAASFLHLGHPERAWRAMAMWRTSWLSREVIVLPVFIAVVALWWLTLQRATAPPWLRLGLPLLLLLLSTLLWWCTAMIYACIRFIQEWAHPITVALYGSIGMATGALWTAVLALLSGQPALARELAPLAATLTAVAWLVRAAALRRNAGLKPRSTLQSATGIRGAPLVQKSMGLSAGSFNTREFFHGAGAAALRHVRLALHGLGFALPLALLVAVALGSPLALLPLALVLQVPGVLAERWLFFAQARHPQNLYYQTVS